MSVFFLFCCPVKSKYLCFTEYDYIYSNALLHCLKRWLKWLNCSENAVFVFVSYFFFDHLTFAMPALVFTKLPLYKLCYRDSCLIVCLSTDRSVKKFEVLYKTTSRSTSPLIQTPLLYPTFCRTSYVETSLSTLKTSCACLLTQSQ